MTVSSENSPLVSVIVPTYNRAELLERAINCSLGQKGEISVEVLVVDDCSSDSTADVVTAYDDPRVRYLRHETNQGGAAARNTGILSARGRYIAFLDSDDEWDPDKLTLQIDALAHSSSPSATVCHTQVRTRRQRSTEIAPKKGKAKEQNIADYLFLAGGHMQTSSILLDAALAKRTLFDGSLRKHQDYDFCLRLEEQGAHFLLLERPLVTWHHDARADRITNTHGLEASAHFLETRRTRLGPHAAEAFWLSNVFPKLLKLAPVRTSAMLASKIIRRQLRVGSVWSWLQKGISRRISAMYPSGSDDSPPRQAKSR
jgi:glycosyltransferase involved in cell wall biosynthesis